MPIGRKNRLALRFEHDLQKIRMSKGLDVQDIFKRTKIRPEVIERLETTGLADDPVFSTDIYKRPLIRNYSQGLGIDAEDVLRAFEMSLTGQYDGFLAKKYVEERESTKPVEKKEVSDLIDQWYPASASGEGEAEDSVKEPMSKKKSTKTGARKTKAKKPAAKKTTSSTKRSTRAKKRTVKKANSQLDAKTLKTSSKEFSNELGDLEMIEGPNAVDTSEDDVVGKAVESFIAGKKADGDDASSEADAPETDRIIIGEPIESGSSIGQLEDDDILDTLEAFSSHQEFEEPKSVQEIEQIENQEEVDKAAMVEDEELLVESEDSGKEVIAEVEEAPTLSEQDHSEAKSMDKFSYESKAIEGDMLEEKSSKAETGRLEKAEANSRHLENNRSAEKEKPRAPIRKKVSSGSHIATFVSDVPDEKPKSGIAKMLVPAVLVVCALTAGAYFGPSLLAQFGDKKPVTLKYSEAASFDEAPELFKGVVETGPGERAYVIVAIRKDSAPRNDQFDYTLRTTTNGQLYSVNGTGDISADRNKLSIGDYGWGSIRKSPGGQFAIISANKADYPKWELTGK